MMSPTIEIGLELKQELDKGYDIQRIANWADNLFFYSRRKFPNEVDEILQSIYMMDAGPEFIFSEKELRLLAEKMINNEAHSLQQVLKLRSN